MKLSLPGKGTLLNLIEAFLGGDENVAHVPLQELGSDRFAIQKLYHMLANICPELSEKAVRDMAKFNMATGQDTISASIKHVNEPIKFKSFAKMMFSVNQFPGLPSYDDPNANAFFNRWVGIRFEKMFYDAEAFERKKEMGEENIGLKDPNILNKLATKEELSGLLNFTLEGLQRVKERGWALMELQTMSELKETWKRQGDPANAFFEERVEQGDPEDERYWSPKTGLFERYIDFRNSYNLGSESRQTFYEKVKRRFGSGVKEKQHRLEGKMTRCFDGIRYVDEGEDEENEQSTLC